MDLGLGNKVAFVTGASGGIGQALIRAFAEEDARVAGLSRSPALAPTDEARWMWLAGDVRCAADLDDAMSEIERQWKRVDVCVVNAGIWPTTAVPLDEMEEERVRDVLETDLLGATWTARAFLRSLRRTGPRRDGHGASLIFIGSTAGRFGERGHAEYATCKAALRGLLLSLKNEIVALDPSGRVNLVEPGWTLTPMAQEAIDEGSPVEAATRTMPLRRLATTEDVAAAVLFFASPVMAGHITGESLTVAGGMEGRVLW